MRRGIYKKKKEKIQHCLFMFRNWVVHRIKNSEVEVYISRLTMENVTVVPIQ